MRIGIDLGGTKIAGIVIGDDGEPVARHRRPAPRNDYPATVDAIADVVAALERDAGACRSIGIGMPGSISPRTGLAQNGNSVWLNGKPFGRDLEARLGRPVRLANDANCFALSEATDGAGRGAKSVFGVIIGTGCGGGLIAEGRLIDGPHAIAGEWGHTPLPWPQNSEYPGTTCWCGRKSCIETWVSGTGLERDHKNVTGETRTGEEIATAAGAGNAAAQATLDRHADRLARGLSIVVNIFDPEVIVLGGGLSQLSHLYRVLPELITPHVFADHGDVTVLPPKWGDASGVRGAAWLWGL
jgi:fructokinase